MAGTDTKQRIIRKGAGLMHRNGYNHTGIQEVLDMAGVPKGSFYFYFKNKEDFGLHIIDFFSDNFKKIFIRILLDESLSPLERLKKFFTALRDYFNQQNCTLGCPFGNISQEMSDQNEKFRKKLNGIFEQIREAIASILLEARDCGEMEDIRNIDDMAGFIFNGWEGALIDMKLKRSCEPLDVFIRTVFNQLLK